MMSWQEVNEQLVLANHRARDLMQEAKLDQEKLRVRERQQAAVAELGQRALGGLDLQSLMNEAAHLLAEALEVEIAKVLELLPGGEALLLRAGVGWKDGVVGQATVGADRNSQAGYTLASQEPVIVEDLREETRFDRPPLLVEHGIVSGMSVIVHGEGRPFGVLGVHSTRRRTFTIDDVHFLQAVSNVLASAIERKRIEGELERSRDELRAILEGVADGITVQDTSGALIFANDAAARLSGYGSAEELVRAPVEDVLARFELRDEKGIPVLPGDLPGHRAIRGEDAPEMMLRFRVLGSGEERWSIVKARAVLDESGRPQMAINIFRDITERRHAEDAQRFLADATALFASSLDYEATLSRVARLAVPKVADWCTVHLVGDEEALVLLAVAHVDPARIELAREMRDRYPPDRAAPRGIWNVLRTGQPELYPEITDDLIAATARDEEHLRLIRELGMKSAMLVPMVARGRTLGVISLVSAESGRRYGPEDLTLAQHLGRRAALAVDNARLYREAHEAVRVRNELFSSISHDLKNPLTGIKGMAQLLKRQMSRIEMPGKGRLLEGLASIDTTANRMTAQIDELLDLARLQSGQAPLLNRRLTDLVSLARETAEEQQSTTERHRIVVEAQVPELLGNWDALRLTRVATNLISNAIKYSPKGGDVLVTVDREEADAQHWAVLTVSDHGIGIPASDVDRIFEGFQRGRNAEGRIAGSGLGLTSARQIIDLHGGVISVASREGEGTTFTVRLPLTGQKPL